MSFERKIKARIIKFLVFAALGAVAVSVSYRLGLVSAADSFSANYLRDTGFALIAGGVIFCVKNLLLLRNKEKLRARKIEEKDERNRLSAYKAGYYSMLFVSIGLYLSSFYFAFVSEELLRMAVIIICALLLCYAILYYLFHRLL